MRSLTQIKQVELPRGAALALPRQGQAPLRWSDAGSILDQDLHAAIGAPPLCRRIGCNWARLADALGRQAVGWQLEVVDEELLDQLGAPFRQLPVVGRVPHGIA